MNMRGILARHGIPEQVFSDNGPQISCTEFANSWGFVHLTSSPQYPQPNGLAEKAVQTAKIIIGRQRHRVEILTSIYHTTSISDCGKSPAQLLMSRHLRYILPSPTASLQPVFENPEVTQRRLEEKQEKQKMFYDQNAKTCAGISVGDHILLRKNTGGYQSAVGIEKADTPRSYNFRTKDGAVYRRTSRISRNRDTMLVMCLAMAAPEALRYEIPSEPQLPVTRHPRIPTVSPPNQLAEVPVADVPVVPSEVNNLPLRQMSWNQYNAWKLHAGGEHNPRPTVCHDCFYTLACYFFLAINR